METLKKIIKNRLRFVFSRFFYFFAGIFCSIGVVTVLAAWPTSPHAEIDNGWIGSVFDLSNSSSSKLTIKGDTYAKGFYYSSDRNLKESFETIQNPLEKINQLEGVAFQWKENGKQDLGLIAQDVEKVFPELVSTNKQTGLKSVEYANLIAVLIEAVKEQQLEIENLSQEITTLKNQ